MIGKGQPGPGRPKGSVNKSTLEMLEEIHKRYKGKTPLRYMLDVVFDPRTEANGGPTQARRDDMAKAAAPYVHSRLTSTDITSGGEVVRTPPAIKFVFGADDDE